MTIAPLVTQPPCLPDEFATWDDIGLPGKPMLSGHREYEGVALADADFADCAVSHPKLSQVRFSQVDLRRSNFPGALLTDVRMDACDLANAQWRGTVSERLLIANSRMVGFCANECKLTDVTIEDTNLQLAQFRFSEIKRAKFVRCDLTGADFHSSNLSGAIFEDCEMTDCDLSLANLNGADVRSSRFDALRIDAGALKGLIVEPMQAVRLAAVAGLVVRYD